MFMQHISSDNECCALKGGTMKKAKVKIAKNNFYLQFVISHAICKSIRFIERECSSRLQARKGHFRTKEKRQG